MTPTDWILIPSVTPEVTTESLTTFAQTSTATVSNDLHSQKNNTNESTSIKGT